MKRFKVQYYDNRHGWLSFYYPQKEEKYWTIFAESEDEAMKEVYRVVGTQITSYRVVEY